VHRGTRLLLRGLRRSCEDGGAGAPRWRLHSDLRGLCADPPRAHTAQGVARKEVPWLRTCC